MGDPVYFGIAGWSYPDWAGCVYPPRLPARDHLAYVAAYVDMVEVNSTFYRPPSARSTETWARKAEERPGFFFTAKVHRDVTHGGVLDPELIRSFNEGMEPLRATGKLRQLLAQFRYDFADAPRARDHLQGIRDAFEPVAPLVLELRHNSWQAPGALDFLGSLGVTVANLDYPTARDSFNLLECRVGLDGYLRLHGRNRKAWFDKNAGRDEAYNYLYDAGELAGLRDRIFSLRRSLRSLTVVANNHFRGKEIANTLELKSLVTGRPVPVPPLLLAEYPRLAAIVVPPS